MKNINCKEKLKYLEDKILQLREENIEQHLLLCKVAEYVLEVKPSQAAEQTLIDIYHIMHKFMDDFPDDEHIPF